MSKPNECRESLATVSVPGNESDLLERAQAFFEFAANRVNAQHAGGRKTPDTETISSRNHTFHGLTRCQRSEFQMS